MSPLPKRILVAFDFSPPSIRALERARELASALGAAVDVVHVLYDPYEDIEHPPPESVWGDKTETAKHMKSLEAHLRAEVESVFGDQAKSVGRHVVHGDISEEVLALADQLGAQLIIVGSKGKTAVDRFLLGSVSNRILHKSPVAVLTVP